MEDRTRRVARGTVLISSILSAFYLLACWWASRFGSDWLLKNVALPMVGIFLIALLYNIIRIAYALIGVGLRLKWVDRTRLASRVIFCGISIPILTICLVLGAWIRR